MKKIFILLFSSLLFSAEMEVDGNLNVTDTLHVTTIQSATIDSLLSLIAQLEMRIAQLECQNTGIIPDGYCDCFFHTLDECGVCNGDTTSCQDCAGVPNGDNLEDNCSVCDNDSSNDCVQDCFGEWGGTAVEDVCGDCGGVITDGNYCENYALNFNGSDECIKIPYAEQYMFNETTSFTIEMWVQKYGSGFVWQFGQEEGNDHQIYIRMTGASNNIRFWIGDNEPELISNDYVHDSWTHIAGIFDSSTATMYLFINGQYKDSLAGIEFKDYGESFMLIGCDKDNGSLNDWFQGLIDEVRISNIVRYNTTFTPQEYFVNDENTIGLWRFEQNINDSSIYENNNGEMLGNPNYVERE